jgi:hypothetical protein
MQIVDIIRPKLVGFKMIDAPICGALYNILKNAQFDIIMRYIILIFILKGNIIKNIYLKN